MAKSRAQRKAEQRKRAAAEARRKEGQAQHDTEVGRSADVDEAELAERGVDLDQLRGKPGEQPEPAAPAPSRADVGRPSDADSGDGVGSESVGGMSRREQKRAERAEKREREERAKASAERRQAKPVAQPKQRGRILTFFASCWAELKKVQWPDRPTLIQATTITIVFIVIVSAYLGALDAIFSQLVELIL
ncbi:preprotein translocase subunit SecE [Thermoleophilia bacterium SCSIO 60948]|nr:preprotein translocase subunit SecE [Thermoleophilia bacterium SCSIO 60948]